MPNGQLLVSPTLPIEPVTATMEVFATFEVQTFSDAKQVNLLGGTLGDLRACLTLQFGIPTFEQRIVYIRADVGGDYVSLDGDDSVLLKEKEGLTDAKVLMLSRQVDPRYKMEKETSFLEALVARRFEEAKDILESSGVTIDPNCVHRRSIQQSLAMTECPDIYSHPALTVAMMAGFESAFHRGKVDHQLMTAYMSQETELCEVIDILIQKGADVNAVGDESQDNESAGRTTIHDKTPLCAAIQRGSPTLVRLLLEAKADPNHKMKYDHTLYGPDRNNPLGPGNLLPESWVRDISFGHVSKRNARDPRNEYAVEILAMLRAASQE